MSDKIININKIVNNTKREEKLKKDEEIYKKNINRIEYGVAGFKKRLIQDCKRDLDYLKNQSLPKDPESINLAEDLED